MNYGSTDLFESKLASIDDIVINSSEMLMGQLSQSEDQIPGQVVLVLVAPLLIGEFGAVLPARLDLYFQLNALFIQAIILGFQPRSRYVDRLRTTREQLFQSDLQIVLNRWIHSLPS